ncbi:MAG: 50S ribosomal protein L29 [Chloroflexi bacterium]|jgi:large subunit ribosomal protein L29|nr:50S ribosomal protein L29 [Chloroflexota bacterium]
MKARELRQLETKELLERLEKAREELFRLRLSWSNGSLEDPNRIRFKRHEIARILTILRERELAMELVRKEEQGNAK